MVECVGVRRFKVLSRGEKDGYSTAQVEYYDDEEPENEQENQFASVVAGILRSKLSDKREVFSQFGEFPDADDSLDRQSYYFLAPLCGRPSRDVLDKVFGTNRLDRLLLLLNLLDTESFVRISNKVREVRGLPPLGTESETEAERRAEEHAEDEEEEEEEDTTSGEPSWAVAPSPAALWCEHDECLESTVAFATAQELAAHRREAHGLADEQEC